MTVLFYNQEIGIETLLYHLHPLLYKVLFYNQEIGIETAFALLAVFPTFEFYSITKR